MGCSFKLPGPLLGRTWAGAEGRGGRGGGGAALDDDGVAAYICMNAVASSLHMDFHIV
jgi:hypothetical protein